ncbi:MAG: hypothetical protein ABS76_09175 [Pelagibacterium sp. SCN 64-44]|nr:MAG: hypothetical protein ABS76_09175 [Pelagibacterium sp. SCN 64-44]
MTEGPSSKVIHAGFSRSVHWQGRSGRLFDLLGENLDQFCMSEADLYLLAQGGHVLWVGTLAELVADPVSRSRFRLALTCADRVFHLPAPTDPAERLSLVWELEGAEPARGVQAA